MRPFKVFESLKRPNHTSKTVLTVRFNTKNVISILAKKDVKFDVMTSRQNVAFVTLNMISIKFIYIAFNLILHTYIIFIELFCLFCLLH